jgi:hypothetical protein
MKYKKGDIMYICSVISPSKRHYGVVVSATPAAVNVFWFFSKSRGRYVIDNLPLLGFGVIE